MSDRWWWWPAGPAPGQRAVLFFPPAGADQAVARPLVAHAAGLRFGVLRLPGRGVRHGEASPADLEVLIDQIRDSIRALGGPAPILVGHSFGGLLAFGVAHALEQAGRPVGRLVTIASLSPPAWLEEVAAEEERVPLPAGCGGRGAGAARPPAAFVARRTARILAGGGVPEATAAHAELAEQARRLISIDVGLSYHRFSLRPLACPITAVRARDDRMVGPDAIAAWSTVTSAPFAAVSFPGDHFFYRSAPEPLMSLLRMELTELDDGDTYA